MEKAEYAESRPIKVEFKTVTPEMAKRFLKNNVSNRKVSVRLVQQLSADMKRGAFRFTSQGISFNSKNELTDGQHRLLAIVDCGIPQELMIIHCSGFGTAKMLPLDIGKRRSLSDITGTDRNDIALVSQIVSALYGPIKMNADDVINLWNILKDGAEGMITTSQKHISAAHIRAAVILRNLSGNNWNDQYNAMISRKYDDMTPATQALFNKLLDATTERGHMLAKRNFCIAWHASDPSRKNMKKFVGRYIEQAVEEARAVFMGLAPEYDKRFTKIAKSYAGAPHQKDLIA
jgi:hypothetical protein